MKQNMKQTKHTPGPWSLSKTDDYVIEAVKAGSPYEVCMYMVDSDNEAEDLANARLIAAAPDGIELADWLLEYLRRNTLGTVPTEHGIGTVVDAHLLRCKIESFINKATGGGAK